MGIISNAPENAVKTTVKFFNIEKYFNYYRGVESFEDLRRRKPHPDHIEIAEAELKRKPFLYIGDRKSDIEAAKNAELDAALVDRENRHPDVDADYRVSNLQELGEELGLF
jgi:phosphoglycolate phosphatase-like HAD superfamily hydrolase